MVGKDGTSGRQARPRPDCLLAAHPCADSRGVPAHRILRANAQTSPVSQNPVHGNPAFPGAPNLEISLPVLCAVSRLPGLMGHSRNLN